MFEELRFSLLAKEVEKKFTNWKSKSLINEGDAEALMSESVALGNVIQDALKAGVVLEFEVDKSAATTGGNTEENFKRYGLEEGDAYVFVVDREGGLKPGEKPERNISCTMLAGRSVIALGYKLRGSIAYLAPYEIKSITRVSKKSDLNLNRN